MARPKSYNVDEVVERVVYAFWQHGYQALGLRELERLTGLNQFAIRSEFGGKEGLYLTALELYTDRAVAHAMQPIRDGEFRQISVFLRSLVTEGSMTSSKYGCLVVNTGIENARVGSPRLDEAVRRYWHELECSFLTCIRNAMKVEEIAPTIDPEATARGLISAVMGVHAQNRLDQKNDAGKELVDFLCSQLNDMELS